MADWSNQIGMNHLPGKCNRQDCPNDAKWQIGLLLHAPLDYKTPPAKAQLGLVVCDFHKEQTKLEDVMDDKGWECIVASFKKAGKLEPERALTQVVFDPIV